MPSPRRKETQALPSELLGWWESWACLGDKEVAKDLDCTAGGQEAMALSKITGGHSREASREGGGRKGRMLEGRRRWRGCR